MAVQNFSGYEAELLGKNIFEMWEEGAKELEKTGIGKVVTAPIRILEKAAGAATGTLEAIPKTAKAIPLILIILAGGVAAYLVFAGKKGTKLIPG